MSDNLKVYRIRKWVQLFESKASEKYKNKSQCYLPLKQGLGYKRLLAMDDGPAMYGCFVAMSQVCSRHLPPRSGWLTVDGQPTSRVYDALDIAVCTCFPFHIVEKTLNSLSCVSIGWIDVYDAKLTLLNPQSSGSRAVVEPQSTSPLPLPSPLPPPPPSRLPTGRGADLGKRKSTRIWELEKQKSHLQERCASYIAKYRFDQSGTREKFSDEWRLYQSFKKKIRAINDELTKISMEEGG